MDLKDQELLRACVTVLDSVVANLRVYSDPVPLVHARSRSRSRRERSYAKRSRSASPVAPAQAAPQRERSRSRSRRRSRARSKTRAGPRSRSGSPVNVQQDLPPVNVNPSNMTVIKVNNDKKYSSEELFNILSSYGLQSKDQCKVAYWRAKNAWIYTVYFSNATDATNCFLDRNKLNEKYHFWSFKLVDTENMFLQK